MSDAHSEQPNQQQLDQFKQTVWSQGRAQWRDLPWRNIDDAYAVLVSEVMLQQTQVARVLDYWPRFLSLFPTLDALAAADTALVLEQWQGLGYNRRALALKRCAEICSDTYDGVLPSTYDELIALPGIGKATAAGVRAFAYQQPGIYLETNVRTVFLHELFADQEGISDKDIEPLVDLTCSEDDPRGWYYALLDYGAHLKQTLPNPSRRSKHYTKQSKFEGSRRQKRAEVVRIVLASEEEGITFGDVAHELDAFEIKHKRNPPAPDLLESILADLVEEGFFTYDARSERYRC